MDRLVISTQELPHVFHKQFEWPSPPIHSVFVCDECLREVCFVILNLEINFEHIALLECANVGMNYLFNEVV